MINISDNDLIKQELERGMIIVNEAGKIIGINNYAADLLQGEMAEIIYSNLQNFILDVANFEFANLCSEDIIDLELITVKDKKIEVYIKVNCFYLKDEELYAFNFVKADGIKLKEKLNLIANFPEKNPNPILKISNAGELLYSNPVGNTIVQALKEEESNSLSWKDFMYQLITGE